MVLRSMLYAVAAGTVLSWTVPALAQRTVTVVREIDTDRYDPHKSTARSNAEVMYMVGDTLVNLDYDMKTLKPGLATTWSVSPDGLTYTFKLRPDVTFCSGKKMTAKEVAASYERWLDPETKGLVKWRMGDVDKITPVDDVTLEYKLKKPFSELLYQMTQYFHTILNVEQARQLGADFGVKGIDGTGPFCFESWTPRDSTVLTKHKGYKWGPPIYDATEAQVDKVIWKVVPEENTRVTALTAGQADASQYVPYWSLKELMANKSLNVSKAENYFWSYFIGFKIDKEMVSDIRVRQAINLAVDQKAIADAMKAAVHERRAGCRRREEAVVARTLVGHHHARHRRIVETAFEIAEYAVRFLQRVGHAPERHGDVFDTHQVDIAGQNDARTHD